MKAALILLADVSVGDPEPSIRIQPDGAIRVRGTPIARRPTLVFLSQDGAPFESVQRLLLEAARAGVGRIRWFHSSARGEVRFNLPRDKGLAPGPVPPLELNEIRISLCADVFNNRMDQHLGYKEKHQDHVADLKAAGRPVGEKCRAWIELDYLKNDTHLLFEHRRHPDRRSENSRIYSAVAERVRTMAKAIGREVPVIIDADGLAPARHVFEFARELGKRGLQSIEFAGHPRLR